MDKRAFRDALGNFATGVCVVTVAPEQGAAIGMTINSFSSVSLDPPLVLWSIQNSSECFDTFSAVDTFAINILSSDQEDFSTRYAMKGDHDLCASHFSPGRTGTPLIKGALTSFECRVWARYPGGDHQIIVGEVLEVNSGQEGSPLLFHQGKYAQVS